MSFFCFSKTPAKARSCLQTHARAFPFLPYAIVNEPFPKELPDLYPDDTANIVGVTTGNKSSKTARSASFTRKALIWWRWRGSNPRPQACKACALPTELHPLLGSFDSACVRLAFCSGHVCFDTLPAQKGFAFLGTIKISFAGPEGCCSLCEKRNFRKMPPAASKSAQRRFFGGPG